MKTEPPARSPRRRASRRPLAAPFVVTVSLGVAACGKNDEKTMSQNPPEPSTSPPTGRLPTWDEVKSGHPEGATNPPYPTLYVTRSGDCYKKWTPPFARPADEGVVESCTPQQCGVRIECPARARAMLAAASASANPLASTALAAGSASAAPSASAPKGRK